jgi:murein DD-endopeptidase MepM/ murein hydrolase activator NlpD
MRRLIVLLLLIWLVPCARAGAASWAPPVRGGPVRLFDLGRDPFVRGRHRGVDLAAAPGEPVRAACGGVVRFAGRVAGTGTVSVDCGRWRVSYAPLERIAVRAGRRVGATGRLGVMAGAVTPRGAVERTAAARRAVAGRVRSSHAGLHFGVRLAARRFGYVDPLGFLAGSRRAPPPLVPAPTPRRTGRPRPPAPPTVPLASPAPAPHPVRPAPGVAPWTVWAGLALLMTGLAGAGTLRLPLRQTGGAACRASSTSSSSPTIPSRP